MKREKKFDHVLIETTGLADPAPVAFVRPQRLPATSACTLPPLTRSRLQTFFINREVSDFYRIDSILCLVDAKHVREHLQVRAASLRRPLAPHPRSQEVKPEDAVNEAVQQVAFADRILLNKTDLVSAAELAEVRDELRSINAYAEVIETQQSVVDLDRILGVSSFSVEKTLQLDPAFLEEEAAAECADEACTDASHGHSHAAHGHGAEGAPCAVEGCAEESHGHGHAHGAKKAKVEAKPKKKRHDLSGVSSVGIACEGELDFNALNGFMMRLLQSRARDIYRSKGVMCFAGQGDSKFVFQGVHEQIHFGPSQSVWAPGEPRKNLMVFIGRKLDREELEKGFVACLAKKKE